MPEKWVPKYNDTVYFVHVYAKYGYDPVWYKESMEIVIRRNMMFKTEEEAIQKVKELGW